ncbi:Anaerobic sulfatase-maturating enzyme homolog YdeM [Mycobacterium tuberculosis]|nr:Anaerobic sulfatase-maturating enzyme homolog YdeM [Mycobacterium tuberculosis]
MSESTLFRQFVLKVHSRCDLACDHCYMFEHADQSWRGRPTVMTASVMERVAGRIADHAKARGLGEVAVVLHGGEPLLAGPDHLADLIGVLRTRIAGTCDVDLRMHTNGVLLDRRFCDMFREQGVKVGISLDGDRAANDRHRRYRDGRSSYDKVVRAIDLLRSDYPDLYSGLLCTIDVANDPIAVYEALLAHEPPAIDLLWPHRTWDDPPPRTPADATPYAGWLRAIADRWLADGRPMPVRMFDSIFSTLRGGPGLTEALGLEDTDLLVVETDGGYEQADSLKTAFDGAPGTGMDVFRHSIEEVGEHPGIRARRGGLAALCGTCRACPVVAACGGGLYAHRYRGDGSRFANPSVYCADLSALIEHLAERDARRSQVLPFAVVRSLATGRGGSAEIARLGTAQASGRRALLAVVGKATAPTPAWDALTRVLAADPVAFDWALAHPYVRAWADERFRALHSGSPADDDGLLATVACTAAARAGVDVTLTVPVRDGAIHFPGIGRHEVPGRTATTVEVKAGELTVAGAGAFQAVRHLRAGTLTVALDDLDPHRDCHDHPAAERLTRTRFEEWQFAFQEAWTLLEKDYAEYAPAIAEALTTMVPLDPPASGASVSSAARDAYGSVGIALPGSPALLCLLIMHEFQHVKLGAVLDFVDLYDAGDERLYHAPWRTDPRPLEGLLQGTYAHIAVADFWFRRMRSREPRASGEAAEQFRFWYPRTVEAVRTLQESGSLTGLGEQFVAAMGRTLAGMVTGD